MAITTEPFYIRYYSGHQGRHGHEFLEFDFRVLSDGKSASARYANNSNYRNDSLIRKEMCVSSLLVDEIKRIIKASEIMKEDDSKWPQKNKDGRQELEIRLGSEHISFETAKIGSLVDVTESQDPEGLRVFYYLVQDLKGFSVVHQTLIFTMEEQNFRKSPQITQVKLMPYVTGCAHLSWNQSLSSCFGNAIPGLAVIGTGNRQAEPSTLFNFSQIKLRYFLDIIKRVATVPVLIHIQKAPSKWRAHTSKAIVDSALFLVLPLLLIRSVPRIFKPSLT